MLREIVLLSSEMTNISVCWDNKNSGFDSAHRTVPCVMVSKRYIESNNIDAHAFKQKAGGVPKNQLSRYDIYKDTANKGKLWVGTKDGKNWRETIYYFKDLVEKWKK